MGGALALDAAWLFAAFLIIAVLAAALDGAATALQQETAGGDPGRDQDKDDQEGGEEPGRIKRKRPAHSR